VSAGTRRHIDEAWHRFAPGARGALDLEARVHVWRAKLTDDIESHEAILSAEERVRAARFHQADDRRRFIVARGILRAILAGALGQGDDRGRAALRLGRGASGKPFLVDHPELFFNVSHSDDIALYAVTRTGEVGIDIERRRPIADHASIARHAFDDAEKAALMGCPSAGRDVVFHRIWTRKEALLKAMGLGLEALADANAMSASHASAPWCLTSLPHIDGFAAALARPRAAHGVRLWSWPNAAGLRSAERRVRPRPMPVAGRPAHLAFEANP
jgi:4'-phosphopantetheinyl transferase